LRRFNSGALRRKFLFDRKNEFFQPWKKRVSSDSDGWILRQMGMDIDEPLSNNQVSQFFPNY
jgi:hypothetical protein